MASRARGKAAAKPAGKSAARTSAKNATRPAPVLKAHPGAKLNKTQLKQLYQRLLDERDKITEGIRRHVGEATADATPLSEEADIAQRATDQEYQLRLADKERKLLAQIQVALEKMETGEYGICEGTEEPIGFRRLSIRPWARYSVEYKERLDRQQR